MWGCGGRLSLWLACRRSAAKAGVGVGGGRQVGTTVSKKTTYRWVKCNRCVEAAIMSTGGRPLGLHTLHPKWLFHVKQGMSDDAKVLIKPVNIALHYDPVRSFRLFDVKHVTAVVILLPTNFADAKIQMR